MDYPYGAPLTTITIVACVIVTTVIFWVMATDEKRWNKYDRAAAARRAAVSIEKARAQRTQ
jgi:hypothetical protein